MAELTVPLWLPSIIAAITAALPYFVCRFSLRTLLVAMTLVAVVLGLMVWLTSK